MLSDIYTKQEQEIESLLKELNLNYNDVYKEVEYENGDLLEHENSMYVNFVINLYLKGIKKGAKL